jgi:hypothetical protein
MKKIILIASLLLSATAGLQAFAFGAADAVTPCLTLDEQKDLGLILQKYEQAVDRNPECIGRWGAAGCLSPYEQTAKNYYERKLKACAQVP